MPHIRTSPTRDDFGELALGKGGLGMFSRIVGDTILQRVIERSVISPRKGIDDQGFYICPPCICNSTFNNATCTSLPGSLSS